MSVVCGIDFTPASINAAAFGARLAARWGTALHLVHVIDYPDEPMFGRVREEMSRTARVALEREAQRLREGGADPEIHLLEGKPDEAIVELATRVRARAVVIAALGNRSKAEWQLGASADRIAQSSPVPTLVIRDAAPFNAWLDGQRRLRMMIGVDRTEASRNAIAFARELRAAGPIDVVAVHLYWASEEHRRLGLSGIRSLVDADPEVEKVLKRELEAEVGDLPGTGSLEFRVELTLGRAADRLAGCADAANADLLVVGSHRRNLLDRLWNGSTSRNVLQRARCSVACVTSVAEHKPRATPRIRSVLVATDFSDAGDAAAPWAYAMVEPGGVVHLMHVSGPSGPHPGGAPRDLLSPVLSGEERARQQEIERRLKALEPDSARARDVTTEVHAVLATRTADAILKAAERLGVNAIVVGTRGRSGMTRAVLGSVAQEVGAKSGRPVLMVHPLT